MQPLTSQTLKNLTSEFEAKPSNRIALNAVTQNGIEKAAHNFDKARYLQRRFSVSVDNGEVTSQAHSGRCWLFSSLNVARFVAKKNLGIKDFEFSQSYAMYFDKLERANYFLQDMAGLIAQGEDEQSRLVQHLLTDLLGDGGQWTMAMNIYTKYGAVPKDFFPETASSQNTGPLNTQLRRVLRQAVARMYQAGDSGAIAAIAQEALATAHRILTIHLGTPPTSFDWEWTDDQGTFHRDGTLTPQEFWNKYVDAGLEDYVCLVDDPRSEHPKGTKIAIEHLGNVADGAPTEYLNVDSQFMKDCVRTILSEQGIPVWFGADCHPMLDRTNGAWALDLYDYETVYDTTFDLTKEERVRFDDSAMNHAMAFVGVDIADDGTTTNRWRVENSWGSKIADKGYFTMDDPWFDEFVYEVAVPKSMLPVEYKEALEKDAISLPAWDPMGALAR